MSVVQSSTVRIKEALHVSSILIESCFESLFFHFSLQVMGVMAGEERGVTIGLYILVFDSFMSSIQNLFTKGNWGVLFTGYIMQNLPLPEGSLL